MVGIYAVLTLAMVLQSTPNVPNAKPVSSSVSQAEPQRNSASPATVREADDVALKLLGVKRIYVEPFGDDPIAKQVHAMVISTLTESKKFIVTENKEKADAILKGAGLEKTSQEVHSYSEGTAAGHAAGGHSASVSGSSVGGVGTISGSSSGGFAAAGAAIQDSGTSTETINDARIAVRLVDRDGDVIWAATKESKGAKYKGASADVAEQVVKQLLRDLEKLEKRGSQPSPPKPN